MRKTVTSSYLSLHTSPYLGTLPPSLSLLRPCLSPSDVLLRLSYIGLAQALNHFGLGYSTYYAPLGYHV